MNLFSPGKKVYSECFAEYRLSSEDLERLQECLLGIFTDIKKLCDENDIGYIVCGGTLLGTIRHKGFIPWDDDIDIMMLREDFDKFRRAFEAASAEGHMSDYMLAIPYESPDYYFKIPKFYAKDTEYVSVNYMGNPKYNMVGVDIFILDKVPAGRISAWFWYRLYHFAYYASALCLDYIHPSPVILEKSREYGELRRYYSFRRTLGAIFSHLGGIGFYLGICRRLSEYSGKTPYRGVASDSRGEIFEEESLKHPLEGQFCGLTVKIPESYDRYLSSLYGDYMQIPPEEKREIHVAYSMKIGDT